MTKHLAFLKSRISALLFLSLFCLAFSPEARAQSPFNPKTATEKDLRKEQRAAKRQARDEAREKKERAMLMDEDYMDDSAAYTVPEKEEKPKEIRQKRVKKVRETEEDLSIEDVPPVNTHTLSQEVQMEDYAKTFQGVPYRAGGMDSKGFDCSGFTCTVFAKQGMQLPRTSQAQFNACGLIAERKAQKGDLVFFGKSKGRISHVGMVVSDPGEELTMIHASSSQGITVTNIEQSSYWKSKLVSVGRFPGTLTKD